MANNLFSSISSLHTDDETAIKYEELSDDKSKSNLLLTKGSHSQHTPNYQAGATVLNQSHHTAENKLLFLQRAYQNPLDAFFMEPEVEDEF